MKLNNKLMLILGVLFSVTLMTTTGVGYVEFRNESISKSRHLLSEEARLIGQAVDERMSRNFDTLNLAARQLDLTAHSLDASSTLSTLEAIVDTLEVLNAYVALENGQTFSTSSGGFVPNFNARDKQREWYHRIFSGETRVITAPYLSAEGEVVMALGVPVMLEGRVVAALVSNMKVDLLTRYIASLSHDNQLWVTREDGYILAAKYPDLIGEDIYGVRPSYRAFKNHKASEHTYWLGETQFFVVSHQIPSLGWTVWEWTEWESMTEASEKNLLELGGMALLFGALLLGLMYRCVHFYVVRPLGEEPEKIITLMQRVANGQLTFDSPSNTASGIYRETLVMAEQLKSLLMRIRYLSGQVEEIACAIDRGAADVNSNAFNQMQQLEQTATAMTEMASSVDDVASNANRASSSVQQAMGDVAQGLALVAEVDTGLRSLGEGVSEAQQAIELVEEQSRQVEKILDVIQAIAEQTNLLALNAAIEAARAGEQGRGFAVVADEVRQLASRTQSSTAEIQSLITGLQSTITRSVTIMSSNTENVHTILNRSQSASVALQTIEGSVLIIQDQNGLVATATEEQSVVGSQINQSVHDAHTIATTTQQGSERNRGFASELMALSNSMDEQITRFELD
ncbi:methyl-accepting chemotaxis protein [Vibrio coralliilyticus]|uniref:methyl-accepting chemotaxis protein n=1 Tax=Vibrio coralliilyticus TaxID=190893 RepID=UPI0015609F16|nr:methyl-accepting chemotaxis protein [Vibrio coralliilyticus]NRF32209.1 methyl-accepting chemotaxis protein [Vibrio coralliilyticus]NRF53296.1 methyl-accepting chemotaxis protein [Vibrio coralliilyticus]NRG03464.1 methyl-accepting chemotaxis protein [Vibrio coralliilyticus]